MNNIKTIVFACLILTSNTQAFLFENRSPETIYVATFQTISQLAQFLSTHGWATNDLNRIEQPKIVGNFDAALSQENMKLNTLGKDVKPTKAQTLHSKTWSLAPRARAVWNWKNIQRELKCPNCTHLFFALFPYHENNVNYKKLVFVSALDIKAKLSYLGASKLKEKFYEEHVIESKPVSLN